MNDVFWTIQHAINFGQNCFHAEIKESKKRIVVNFKEDFVDTTRPPFFLLQINDQSFRDVIVHYEKATPRQLYQLDLLKNFLYDYLSSKGYESVNNTDESNEDDDDNSTDNPNNGTNEEQPLLSFKRTIVKDNMQNETLLFNMTEEELYGDPHNAENNGIEIDDEDENESGSSSISTIIITILICLVIVLGFLFFILPRILLGNSYQTTDISKTILPTSTTMPSLSAAPMASATSEPQTTATSTPTISKSADPALALKIEANDYTISFLPTSDYDNCSIYSNLVIYAQSSSEDIPLLTITTETSENPKTDLQKDLDSNLTDYLLPGTTDLRKSSLSEKQINDNTTAFYYSFNYKRNGYYTKTYHVLLKNSVSSNCAYIVMTDISDDLKNIQPTEEYLLNTLQNITIKLATPDTTNS